MKLTLEETALRFGITPETPVPDWELVLKLEEFWELAEKNTNTKWHLERNMFLHTQMVCCEMHRIVSDPDREWFVRPSDQDRLVLMLAALFHDIGKCRCEQDPSGRLLSHGHPDISERLCRKILWNTDTMWRERICEMVRLHDLYCDSNVSDRKLLQKISGLSPWLFLRIEYLLALFEADDHGSTKDPSLCGGAEYMSDRIRQLVERYDFHVTKPYKNLGEFTVYVMCGLPGSGKSTWAQENLPDLPVVSRDLIREELGMTEKGVKFMGNPEQEDLVSDISRNRVIELCNARKSFVYDNMNSREKYRKGFLESIRKYNPVVRFIYLEVSDMSTLESRRPEITCKGDDVFEDMVYKMEFPRPFEYDTIEILQDWSMPEKGSECRDLGMLHLQNYSLKRK